MGGTCSVLGAVQHNTNKQATWYYDSFGTRMGEQEFCL